jgi:membrane protein DedA with SNARE-associated domain
LDRPRRGCRRPGGGDPRAGSDRLIDQVILWLAGLPPAGIYGVIALSAALENIVPPIPADTAVALGAFLAGQGGTVTMTGIFLATWVPNVVSAAGMYWVARTVGRSFAESPTGQRLLSPRAMRRLEQAYARHHSWGIFVSRFLPGYRAVVPAFAGLVRLGPWRTLLPVAIASGLWYGFLILLAHRLGSDWDAIRLALGRVGLWLAGAALVASFALAVAVWRRRRSDAAG